MSRRLGPKHEYVPLLIRKVPLTSRGENVSKNGDLPRARGKTEKPFDMSVCPPRLCCEGMAHIEQSRAFDEHAGKSRYSERAVCASVMYVET